MKKSLLRILLLIGICFAAISCDEDDPEDPWKYGSVPIALSFDGVEVDSTFASSVWAEGASGAWTSRAVIDSSELLVCIPYPLDEPIYEDADFVQTSSYYLTLHISGCEYSVKAYFATTEGYAIGSYFMPCIGVRVCGKSFKAAKNVICVPIRVSLRSDGEFEFSESDDPMYK